MVCKPPPLTVGSLFSGIGGLDLGLERAGMVVRWQSEIDPFASSILARHWPSTPNLGDITAVDWSTVEPVDVICGGYPCQPFSDAGRRKGEDDDRHLWPYFAGALRHLRPRHAILENVPGHLSLGFGRVLGDLAELGFDAEWDCIPAAAVGAPHLRYRLFVVAESEGSGLEGRGHVRSGGAGSGEVQGVGVRSEPGRGGAALNPEPLADADACRRERRSGYFRPGGWPEPAHSDWWTVEPDVGRVAHGVPGRVGQLHALGNAVVPQVAEHVGRVILARR